MTRSLQRVQGFAVAAMLLGACASQAPSIPAGSLRTQAASAAEVTTGDWDDLKKPSRPSKPNKPRQPRRPSPKPSTRAPRPRPSARPSRPSPDPTPVPPPPSGRPDPYYPNPVHPPYYGSPWPYYPPGTRDPGPEITRVWTDGVTSDRVTVSWTTDRPARGMVQWRDGDESSSSGWRFPSDTFQSYTIKGLLPDTEYQYRVIARYEGGGTTVSPLMTVRTAGDEDSER